MAEIEFLNHCENNNLAGVHDCLSRGVDVNTKDMFEETRTVLEPAGALALAGAKKWKWTDLPLNFKDLPLKSDRVLFIEVGVFWAKFGDIIFESKWLGGTCSAFCIFGD